MVIRCGFVFLLSVASWTFNARADGVSIQSTIGVRELVAKSPTIVTARILSTQHVRRAREAYGRKQEYVERFQFKVTIESLLRGEAPGGSDGALWIAYRGDPLPGKWVVVREWYATDFSAHAAKSGDRILVFLGGQQIMAPGGPTDDESSRLQAIEIENIDRLGGVKAEIAKADKANSRYRKAKKAAKAKRGR